MDVWHLAQRFVESICVLKATHNNATPEVALVIVESICVLKATHNSKRFRCVEASG